MAEKDMLANRPKIEERVKAILSEYPQAKGDDMILIWRYCQRYSRVRISFAKFQDLLMSVCFESIRRSRQKVQAQEKKQIEAGLLRQEDSKYLPTERVRGKRRKLEIAHIEYYGEKQMRLSA